MKFFVRPSSTARPLRCQTASLPDRFAARRLGKCGAMGEGILMIYRLVVISFIAIVVLGLSSVFYDHYIDVRDAEARIMARNVVDCLAPYGVLDLKEFSEEDRKTLLSRCGFGESERFYVGVEVFNSTGGEVAKMYHGDSGALWVRELFEDVSRVERIKKYNPGYFNEDYDSFVLDDGGKDKGKIQLEVLVNG